MISNFWDLIVILIQIVIILLLVDVIFWVLGQMFSISWKKLLMGFATVFSILWLKDYLEERKQRKLDETKEDGGETDSD